MTSRMLPWTMAFLLLVPLAPFAAAGHVQVDFNPCSRETGMPVPGCRDGEPIGDCWRFNEREGGWQFYPDPVLCPDGKSQASCLAVGLLARDAGGLVTVQNSRSAASVDAEGRAAADANQQRVDTFLGGEGTLMTECKTQPCDSSSKATAVGVSLLGGAISIGALEATASATCWEGPQTHVKVASLVINGYDYGDIVHPSTIVVPGVGVVTIGQTDYFPNPGGYAQYGVSTTALRVDLIDALGIYRGTIRVSHAAAAI